MNVIVSLAVEPTDPPPLETSFLNHHLDSSWSTEGLCHATPGVAFHPERWQAAHKHVDEVISSLLSFKYFPIGPVYFLLLGMFRVFFFVDIGRKFGERKILN